MNELAPCYGKLYGHNFAFTGADCSWCGVNQNALLKKPEVPQKNYIEKFQIKRVPVKGIHSGLHALVNEIRTELHETATKGKGSFGFYIGFFKRVGVQNVYRIWAEIKQSRAYDRKRLFWWKIGQLSRAKSSQGKTVDNSS